MEHDEAVPLQAAYAASTLDEPTRRAVSAHVTLCPLCQTDLASWRAVRAATRASAPLVSAPERWVVESALTRVRLSTIPPLNPRPATSTGVAQCVDSHPVHFAVLLLRAQMVLLQRSLWIASALVMMLGTVLALPSGHYVGTVLALVAPIVAAVGVATISAPETDAAQELTLATPTSTQVVLLARLTLVFGYDLLISLLASAVLAILGVSDMWPLITTWLGPMTLLSAASLLFSVRLGPSVAMTCAVILWSIRVLTVTETSRFGIIATILGGTWSTSLVSALVSAGCVGAALLLNGRQEPRLHPGT